MGGHGRRGIGTRLFLAFALLYVLTMHGRPFSDDVFQFEQVGVLVATGGLVMSPERDPEALGGAGAFMRPGVDGRVYLTLAPGLALAALPLGWLGSKLGWPEPQPEHPRAYPPPRGVTFWASLTVPLVMAAAVWSFFAVVAQTSGSIQKGIQGAIVLGLATNTWFYATTFWTQPLAAACCLWAVALLVIHRDSSWAVFAAGVCLGWAVVTRYELVLIVPWYLALADKRMVRRAVLLAPVVVAGVGLALWNDFRFGDPLQTRSLHQGTGSFHPRFLSASLPGMLLGLQQGLLLYCPAVVLGIVAVPKAWKQERALVIAVVGIVVTLVFLYGSFVFWSTPSPMSWGSRFLYPAVPLLLLPAFCSRHAEPLRPVWARIVVAVSGLMALTGVVQRVRLGPPFWWIDDSGRASVAAVLVCVLVVVVLRLNRDYARSS